MRALARQLALAREQLQPVMPLDEKTFDPEAMDPSVTLALDGFRARFADLQDMLGKAMFKSLARLDQDESPGNELTTRERLALMEKRGILETEKWNEAREIRNAFVHDYPDRHPEKAAAYNAAWRFSDYLLEVAENLEAYSRRHHGEALCG